MLAIGYWILARLGRDNEAPRWMAALVAVFAILAACAAAWGTFKLWGKWDDRQAIEQDRAAANAELRAKQLEAERKAGGEKRDRDAADRQEQKDLEDEIEDAGRAGRSAADTVWSGGLFDEQD